MTFAEVCAGAGGMSRGICRRLVRFAATET
jgi:hypothetical protein